MSNVRKVERNGTVRWRATWKNAAGKPQSKNFLRKAEADAHLRNIGSGAATGSTTMTVKELAVAHNRWFGTLVRAGVREQGTLDGYETMASKHVAGDAAFATTRLCDLTTPKTQAFLDGLMERSGSIDVVRRARDKLSAFFEYGQRNGYLTHDPAQACKVVQTDRTEGEEDRVEIPAKEDLALLLAEAEKDPRDNAAVRLLMFAGLRASELLGLADDPIAAGRVQIRERRERKYRTLGKLKSKRARRDVPVAATTTTAVKAWRLARGPADRLFGDLHYDDFKRRLWDPLMERAGLGKGRQPNFTPHKLRHVFASLNIEQGVTPKRLQELMGHSTLQLTMDLYGHLWTDDADDAALAKGAESLIPRKKA